MIHLSFDSENNGLRVKDLKCFNKLTELLGMSLRKEMVELESELSEKPTAIIIGDLTLAREMTEEEKETIDLEVEEQETTEGRIISTESIMKELTALKTHINSEW